ncbi:MAG TPA: hypothetical protein VEQ16_02325 [Acidocella sp.]|jgi:hypothetical protein|nr:hypothetical protein [Acidocella sp.]
MTLKPALGAAAIAVLLIGSTQAARADGDDWRGPSVFFSFGGPAYYAPPPPPPPPAYYYAPGPVYAAPGYYAPPAYYAPPGYWRCHHRDDDDD